jgi:transcriptional regulator with XRE-family HTH domain
MDTFDKRMATLHKVRKMTQEELAKLLNTSISVIGKYKRDEAPPSIEAAKKIADAFEVSLDYLEGEGIISSFDKKTVKRIQDIEKLEDQEREHVFAMLDAFLAKNKLQAILK